MEVDQHPIKRKYEEDLEENPEENILIGQSKSKRRTKRQAPYLIFPEILVIIDYDGYRQ